MNLFKNFLSAFKDAFGAITGKESRDAHKKAAREAQAATDRLASRKQQEIERLRGKQRTAYAKAGVKLSGTPTAVIEDSEQQGQLDIDLIKINGQQRVNAHKAQARQATTNAIHNGIRLASQFFP